MEILQGILDLPLWLLLTVISIILSYVYLTWTHDTWSKQGIHGDKPLPLLGTFLPVMKAGSLYISDMEAVKKYGRIYGAYRGRTAVLNVADPEFIRLAFIKEFNSMPNRNDFQFGTFFDKMMTSVTDDRWRHIRSSLTPTFTSGKLKQMVGLINECSQRFAEHLKAIQGEPFQTKTRLGAFTMDVISSTAFGIQIDSQANPDHPMLEYASRMMNTNQKSSLKHRMKGLLHIALFLILPKFIMTYLVRIGLALSDKEAADYFVNITDKIISGRAADGHKHKDFVQLCLDKMVEDPKPGDPETRVDKYGALWTTKGLTRDEIIANAIVFYLAGFETTAATLDFLLYEIAMNTDVQDKLVECITEVIGDKKADEHVTYDEISRMDYLEWCIEESMRLYPAAPRLERLVEKECVIQGIKLPVGSYVSAMTYAMHLDPEYWTEPDKFKPERFSPEQKEGRHPCAWSAFGVGNRNCIGMRLALLVVKIAVVTLLRQFKLETCEKTPQKPLKFAKNFRAEPESLIHLVVTARH